MWEGHDNPGRSLFSRAKERHVFLFEKVVIISKKFEAPAQKKSKKSDNYLYKTHVSVSLCEKKVMWLVFVFKLCCGA